MTELEIESAYEQFRIAIHRHCNPPEEEWLFYKSHMHPRIFKKGEFLIRPGEPSNIYAYIYSGIMKQYFITEDGREYITRFDCPTETSGDAATLWRSLPARQYIEAIQDVKALVTSPNLLEMLRHRHPVWNQGSRSLAEIRFYEKCEREYEFLSYDAQKRYKCFLDRHGANSHNIPQKDIAAYIGITPSSLNKIIQKYKEELS